MAFKQNPGRMNDPRYCYSQLKYFMRKLGYPERYLARVLRHADKVMSAVEVKVPSVTLAPGAYKHHTRKHTKPLLLIDTDPQKGA